MICIAAAIGTAATLVAVADIVVIARNAGVVAGEIADLTGRTTVRLTETVGAVAAFTGFALGIEVTDLTEQTRPVADIELPGPEVRLLDDAVIISVNDAPAEKRRTNRLHLCFPKLEIVVVYRSAVIEVRTAARRRIVIAAILAVFLQPDSEVMMVNDTIPIKVARCTRRPCASKILDPNSQINIVYNTVLVCIRAETRGTLAALGTSNAGPCVANGAAALAILSAVAARAIAAANVTAAALAVRCTSVDRAVGVTVECPARATGRGIRITGLLADRITTRIVFITLLHATREARRQFRRTHEGTHFVRITAAKFRGWRKDAGHVEDLLIDRALIAIKICK